MFLGGLSAKCFTSEICLPKFAGEICLAKFAGEICRRKLPAKFAAEFVGEIFGEKHLVKPNLIFGEKLPQKISLANSTILRTRHRHIPITLPSLRSAQRKQAEVKGFRVLALCRLERQTRGTKRGTKAGVLCSLRRHVSLVGLSLLNCIRWRLGLGSSNSRLQREHLVVARFSKGGGLRFE